MLSLGFFSLQYERRTTNCMLSSSKNLTDHRQVLNVVHRKEGAARNLYRLLYLIFNPGELSRKFAKPSVRLINAPRGDTSKSMLDTCRHVAERDLATASHDLQGSLLAIQPMR